MHNPIKTKLKLSHYMTGQITCDSFFASSSMNSIAGCLSVEDLFLIAENPPKVPGGRGAPICVMNGSGLPNVGGGSVVGRYCGGGGWG